MYKTFVKVISGLMRGLAQICVSRVRKTQRQRKAQIQIHKSAGHAIFLIHPEFQQSMTKRVPSLPVVTLPNFPELVVLEGVKM